MNLTCPKWSPALASKRALLQADPDSSEMEASTWFEEGSSEGEYEPEDAEEAQGGFLEVDDLMLDGDDDAPVEQTMYDVQPIIAEEVRDMVAAAFRAVLARGAAAVQNSAAVQDLDAVQNSMQNVSSKRARVDRTDNPAGSKRSRIASGGGCSQASSSSGKPLLREGGGLETQWFESRVAAATWLLSEGYATGNKVADKLRAVMNKSVAKYGFEWRDCQK